MSSLAKHIIHRPRPYRYLLIIAIAIAISTTSLWFYLQQTNLAQTQKLTNLRLEASSLKNKVEIKDTLIQKITLENEKLIINVSELKSDITIQVITIEQLQLQLENQQQQIATFNKELLFYQSITQGEHSKKIHIREIRLQINPTEDNTINYQVIITQGQKINNPITGSISLILHEEKNGLKMERIIGNHPISLRYVQLLEGKIKIVDNTTPLAVTVKLSEKKGGALSQTFDWQITP